jgi:hypothetical protein
MRLWRANFNFFLSSDLLVKLSLNISDLTGQSNITVWSIYVAAKRLSRAQTFTTFSVLFLSPLYKYAPLQHSDETCQDYKQRILWEGTDRCWLASFSLPVGTWRLLTILVSVSVKKNTLHCNACKYILQIYTFGAKKVKISPQSSKINMVWYSLIRKFV